MRATGVAGVGLLVVALGVALSERGTSGADSRAGLAKRLTDELDFTIPPGSGEKQLRAFTALTGIACAVLVRVLPQRELPAISGHMQVRSALDLLAGNADLQWRIAGGGVAFCPRLFGREGSPETEMWGQANQEAERRASNLRRAAELFATLSTEQLHALASGEEVALWAAAQCTAAERLVVAESGRPAEGPPLQVRAGSRLHLLLAPTITVEGDGAFVYADLDTRAIAAVRDRLRPTAGGETGGEPSVRPTP